MLLRNEKRNPGSFWDEQGVRAYKNISVLTVFTGLGSVLSFASHIILARYLSINAYGTLSASLALIAMLVPLAGFGIGHFWLNVFGLEGWRGRRWLSPSYKFFAFTSVTTCSLLILVVLFNELSGLNPIVVWLTPWIVAMSMTELVSARLQLEERYTRLACWQTLPQLGRFAIAVTVVGVSGELYTVGKGFFAVSILIIIIAVIYLVDMVRGNLRLVGHGSPMATHDECYTPSTIEVPLKSWPFAMTGIFYLIYFQTDILLLNWLIGPEAAGIYSVSITIMIGVYLIPNIIYGKYLLPKQHRWAEYDPDRLLAVYRYGCGMMTVSGLLVAGILIPISPWGTTLIFGTGYSESGLLLMLLGVCVPFRFLAVSVGGLLAVQQHIHRKVIYMGSIAITNVILNLILIPRFSYYGAALSTIICEVSLLVIYLVAVRRWMFGAAAWQRWTLRYQNLPSNTGADL